MKKLTVILAAGLSLATAAGSGPARAQSGGVPLEQQIRNAHRAMVDGGFLRKLDAETSRAWVDRTIWRRLNVDQKESYVSALARVCNINGAIAKNTVTVYDHMSGERLARIGLFGFKIDAH